jgi:hypothetical protein
MEQIMNAEPETQQAINTAVNAQSSLTAVHPAAEIFPELTEAEFAALVADIRIRGLLQPIERYNGPVAEHRGKLIDGRHRERAALAAGVTPHYVDIWIDDPIGYVIAKNILRRHLNNEQKRELIAKALRLDPTQSDHVIAGKVGVSQPTVGKVRTKLEATDKLFRLEKTTGADGRVRRRRHNRTPSNRKQIKTPKRHPWQSLPLPLHNADVVPAASDELNVVEGVTEAVLKLPRPNTVQAQMLERFADGQWRTAAEMGKKLGLTEHQVGTALRALKKNSAVAVDKRGRSHRYEKRPVFFRLQLRGGKSVSLEQLTTKLTPIIESLEAEGSKHYVRIVPPTLLGLAQQLRRLLDGWVE